MRALIRQRFTYANVMATMAVFIALGGSAVAANSIITKSSQIKNGVITGADVKNSSLTGADVRNSSLTGADIKNKSLSADDFNGSVQGAQGPKGDTGAAGPTAGGFAQNNGVTGMVSAYSSVVGLGANGTGKITPAFNGRLLASGTANTHSTAGSTGDVFCKLELVPDGGTASDITKTYGRRLPVQFSNEALTVSGGAAVSAGATYDVRYLCSGFADTGLSVDRAELTAVVVAG
jgi:hypothetical protein